MPEAQTVYGLILAGGRSSRFGREKAAEPLDGRPLIAWVADRLCGGVERLAVSARPGSAAAGYAAAWGLACLPDPQGGPLAGGPLAGVLEGLRWAGAAGAIWLVTAPCDMPFLPSDYVERLVAGRSAGGTVACTSEGLQPLCALWPVTAIGRLAELGLHPPIRSLLHALGAAETPFEAVAEFDNLNTPEAFSAAQTRISARR